MARCVSTRATPIPVKPPINEVTLNLSLEEAAIIRTILDNISGVGPIRNIMSRVSDAMYASDITFVPPEKARIVEGGLEYVNSTNEYLKFLDEIKKF